MLHYLTSADGGPAIVGWSEATDGPSTGTITWQARGTRGRERGHPTTGPSWFVPLGGLHEFATTVRGRDLDVIEDEVFALRADLEAKYGTPVYFPFFQYRPGEIRAQQGYLAKFPVELLDLLPELADVRGETDGDMETELPEDAQPRKRVVPRGKLTRVQDPALRKAIEDQAVDQAIAYYEARGATDIVKLGKPYDIKLKLDGEERHVEVKGSSLTIETVELTINEVMHATDYQPTDLVVVDGIEWKPDGLGKYATSDGRVRIWSDWSPLDEDLAARKFAYFLPSLEDKSEARTAADR